LFKGEKLVIRRQSTFRKLFSELKNKRKENLDSKTETI